MPEKKPKRLPPLIVSDPNDPRLQAYNDSLRSYNVGNSVLRNIMNILNNYTSSDYSKETVSYINNPLGAVEYGENKKGVSPIGYGKKYEKAAKMKTGRDVPIDLKIAAQLKRLDANKVIPYRTISSAELPDRFIYKKPIQPIMLDKNTQNKKQLQQEDEYTTKKEKIIEEKPQYSSPKKFYQGYRFISKSGLRPDWYHPEEVEIAISEKIKKRRNK